MLGREVHAVEGLSKDEKKNLCLSRQTLEGFRITGILLGFLGNISVGAI